MRRLIDFKDMIDSIKKYADENCEGNFNMAVRQLIKKGLCSDNMQKYLAK